MSAPLQLPTFTMPFEPMTIEHLGLRLYSTLPPVISELVSNAYDAESPKVQVTLPKGAIGEDSEVIIRDFGHGLNASELQDEFLPIGRSRRGPRASVIMSKHGKRRVTGRKGLGKLSAFGVAGEMEVRSIQSKFAVCLRLNYADMRRWSEKHEGPYEPAIVRERCGKTGDADGVEIRLRRLHRKRSISSEALRKGLARRLNFIGTGFQVFVDTTPIKPGDRVQRSECAKGFSWKIGDTPVGGTVAKGLSVTGWIGFLDISSQANRGVDIFASGKAVELGSFFNFPSTHAQFARAHLIGEIHADFLDEKEDLVATARNSVVWESDSGQALQEWGQKLLKWSFDQWLDLRREQKTEELISVASFDKWIATRQPSEQRVARRMVALLVDDPKIDPESALPLFDIVKNSVETVAFRELIETIEEQGSTVTTLLRLFEEWRVIEAREHLKLADGRLEAIGQLGTYIRKGALEVQQMQPLFEDNPWLIEPAWTETNSQTTYTKWLRANCTEPKDYKDADRRIDILGIRESGGLTVVELKRPEKTVSRRDLEQIERYIDWARTQFLGSGPDAPRYVNGLLVVGKLNTLADVAEKQRRLAGDDIRVETYRDLHNRSEEYYSKVEKTLERVAPEYTRKHRKAQRRKS